MLEATLYNLPTRRVIRVLRGHEALVGQAVFSPDSRLLATADQNGVVKLWSARAGREVFETGGWTWAMAYSRDGRKLSFRGSGGPVYVCDAESGRRLLRVRMGREETQWASFSPDGRQLALDDLEGNVWLWNLESAQHERTIPCHERAVGIGYQTCLAHSPDGRFLATGSQDRTDSFPDNREVILKKTGVKLKE